VRLFARKDVERKRLAREREAAAAAVDAA
jgi:hypothetical protein